MRLHVPTKHLHVFIKLCIHFFLITTIFRNSKFRTLRTKIFHTVPKEKKDCQARNLICNICQGQTNSVKLLNFLSGINDQITQLYRTQGRRRRKLLDDLKERRGHSHLKEDALDRTMWRARFGRGFGPVVRQTTK